MQKLVAEKERIVEVVCEELDSQRAQTYALVTSTEYAGTRDAVAHVELTRFAYGAANTRGKLSVEEAQSFDLDRWLQDAAEGAMPELTRSLLASVGLDSQAGPFIHVRGSNPCAARLLRGEFRQSAECSLALRPNCPTLAARAS